MLLQVFVPPDGLALHQLCSPELADCQQLSSAIPILTPNPIYYIYLFILCKYTRIHCLNLTDSSITVADLEMENK